VLSYAGEATLPKGRTVVNLRKRIIIYATQCVCSWTLPLSVSELHTLLGRERTATVHLPGRSV
jgi:hypothetical protein